MTTTTPADRVTSAPAPAPALAVVRRLGPLDVLVFAAWCGLASGLLEVGTRVLSRSMDPTGRLYTMSRHFVWLGPLVDLLIFSGFGLVLAMVTKRWPRRGGWLGPRLILFWAVLPVLLIADPRIYLEAWVLLAWGIAVCWAPALERSATQSRRWMFRSFPGLLGIVLALAGLVFGGDRLKQWREADRPWPPAHSPNVLLIVLDTVRADHLSLYGYPRPTTPALQRLARRGIRFEQARAAAPWTLPSHASLFTGRWPHELAVKWRTPWQGSFPTLAEYLGAHGYATAGFVANTLYCSYDTGLDRGFTHYEDYLLEGLSPVRTAYLGDLTLKALAHLVQNVGGSLDPGPARAWQESLLRLVLTPDLVKREAASINRQFLDWLARRPQPGRPFFVFLNYSDTHSAYLLPPGASYRFGVKPQSPADYQLLEQWPELDKLELPQRDRTLAQDSYDNCLAYLDERLGELLDELQRRGALDQTMVIVTADHGEGLGEHELFDHGESLYRPEIRVPLVMVLPQRDQLGVVVNDPVSLRDLPATIADLAGLGTGAPFPGRSLARLWRDPARSSAAAGAGDAVLSELASPNPINPNRGRSPARRGPLISLAEGDFVYIRNQGDGTEELFDERDDPRELTNRARAAAMQPVLQRFRDRLDQMLSSRQAFRPRDSSAAFPAPAVVVPARSGRRTGSASESLLDWDMVRVYTSRIPSRWQHR
ncbi:MAG TPA: sulfatase [Isosphaeraceae bacterium]|nr:sulfatase [Isosphaeraceae bacterium]